MLQTKTTTNRLSIACDVGSELAKNFLMRMDAVRQWRARKPRTISAISCDEVSLKTKALGCLHTVLEHIPSVEGLDILEIGPGDTLVSGLCFLAAGASSYVAIDRFAGNYSGTVARSWYNKVKEVWPAEYPNLRWPEWLDPNHFPECASHKLKLHLNAVEEQIDVGAFDIVCSQDVGEHVSDSRRFAEASRRYLRPGGRAIHNIDFGPHGPWTQYDDPHIFLYFPRWLYNWMNTARGGANRLRITDFREVFAAAGLKVETVETVRFDREPDMRKLPKPLQQLDLTSLMIARATFVCQL